MKNEWSHDVVWRVKYMLNELPGLEYQNQDSGTDYWYTYCPFDCQPYKRFIKHAHKVIDLLQQIEDLVNTGGDEEALNQQIKQFMNKLSKGKQ